jgi:hypothetical protein
MADSPSQEKSIMISTTFRKRQVVARIKHSWIQTFSRSPGSSQMIKTAAVVGIDRLLQAAVGSDDMRVDVEGAAEAVGDDGRVAQQRRAVGGPAEVVPMEGKTAAVVGKDRLLQAAVGSDDIRVDVEGAAEAVGDDGRVAQQRRAVGGPAEVVPMEGKTAAVASRPAEPGLAVTVGCSRGKRTCGRCARSRGATPAGIASRASCEGCGWVKPSA